MSWRLEGNQQHCERCNSTWKVPGPSSCKCAAESLEEIVSAPSSIKFDFSAADKKSRVKLQTLTTLKGLIEHLTLTLLEVDTDKAWGPAKRAEVKLKIVSKLLDAHTQLADLEALQDEVRELKRIEG